MKSSSPGKVSLLPIGVGEGTFWLVVGGPAPSHTAPGPSPGGHRGGADAHRPSALLPRVLGTWATPLNIARLTQSWDVCQSISPHCRAEQFPEPQPRKRGRLERRCSQDRRSSTDDQ